MTRRLIPNDPNHYAPRQSSHAGPLGLVTTAISSLAMTAKGLFSTNALKAEQSNTTGQSINEPAVAAFFDEVVEIDRQSVVTKTQNNTFEIGTTIVDRVHVADKPAFLLACHSALTARQILKVRMKQVGQGHFTETEITLQCHLGKIFAAMRSVAAPALDFDRNDQSRELAHELCTPLAAIVGLADTLLHDEFCTEEMRRTYPALIAATGRNLIDMTVTVLEPHSTNDQKINVALSTISKDCLALLQPMAKQKSITIFDRLPQVLAAKAVEEVAMRQILTNLLSNAIKFSPDGGSVELTAAMAGNGWVLKVTDNGLGLSPEDIARLGQKNFRSVKAAGIAGHGLGLSIVYRLVDKIGGRISFESRPGKGTQVAISFPGTSLSPFAEPKFQAPLKTAGPNQSQTYAGEKHAAA